MILLSSAMNSRRAVLLTPWTHVERDVLAKNTYEHVVGGMRMTAETFASCFVLMKRQMHIDRRADRALRSGSRDRTLDDEPTDAKP